MSSTLIATGPTFTLNERERRWAVARQLMADLELDALVVYGDREGTGPAPFAPDVYFTNDRPGAVVIFCPDAEPYQLVFSPMAISDHLEALRRGEEVWISPDHVGVGRNPLVIADVLKRHGLERATIGVVGLEPYPPFYLNGAIPHGIAAGLAAMLPDAKLQPVWLPLAQRMARLSDEEIAVVDWCARVGEKMAQAMAYSAKAGAKESDLVAAAMREAYAAGAASPYIVLGSGRAVSNWGPPAWLYRPQPPRVLASGDLVLAELFATYGMLETQHQVAIAIGDVDPDYERLEKVCLDAYNAGLERLRPGATFSSVLEAMQKPVRDAGAWNLTPLVHGLNPILFVGGCGDGLDNLPGADRYFRLGAIPTIGGDVEIEQGMTFAFEPDCTVGGKQMNLGTTVVVDRSGPRELAPFTNRLIHVDP